MDDVLTRQKFLTLTIMSTLIETNCWKINNKLKSIEIHVA